MLGWHARRARMEHATMTPERGKAMPIPSLLVECAGGEGQGLRSRCTRWDHPNASHHRGTRQSLTSGPQYSRSKVCQSKHL